MLGGSIPACLIVLGSYMLMAMGYWVGRRRKQRSMTVIFWIGLSVATTLAMLATILELLSGKVCPRLFGWLPMCYLSLGACIMIASLYLTQRRQVGSS